MDSVSALFRPLQIKSLRLPNRVVMAPMTRWFSPNGVPGPDVAAYYSRRAANDCGLIITEGTVVDHPVSSYSTSVPNFFGQQCLKGWKRVVDEVHEAGGRIIPQLWHVGAMRPPGQDYPNPDLPPVSPSGLFRPGKPPNADPMTSAEIGRVVDAFATGARNARELGFDGVSVHGAHGYLIDQFLWPATNQRSDEYGVDLEGRTRFAVEVLRAIRQEVGDDFPLFLRISQWKQQDYAARLAHSPEELKLLLNILVDAGVDVFHCSQRRFWEPEFEGSTLNLAGWVKRLTGKPSITVGSVGLADGMHVGDKDSLGTRAEVGSLNPLIDRLERGEFDLVAVGRGMLADPEWAKKVRIGCVNKLNAFDKGALQTLY